LVHRPAWQGRIYILPVSYKSMRKNIKSVSALFSQALGCVNPYGKIWCWGSGRVARQI